MKLPPFTLIYQNDLDLSERRKVRLPSGKKGAAKSAALEAFTSKSGSKTRAAQSSPSDKRLATIRKTAPDLAKSLKTLPPKLSDALLSSSFAQQALGTETETAAETLRPVLKDLRRGKTTVTVALWDLDARVGELPEIIGVLNESQPVFTFFDLQAPIPSGLVIQAEHFAAWALKRLDRRFSKKDREEFQNNLMFDDFYKYARRVREELGVDCLVGITKDMVAFERDEKLFWNHFTASKNRIILASTYDVREYARRAGRPFEAAVSIMVIARLLATLSTKVKYHPDRGCIFDGVKNRDLFVEKIKAAQIEPDCLKLIDAKYRSAAEAMIQALRNYSREEKPEKLQAMPPDEKHDDAYWLRKLKSLSKELGSKSK